MEVFRRIERFHRHGYVVSKINGIEQMTYTLDETKMILSDMYSNFTVDWVIDGKINDMYYYTTPLIVKNPVFYWAGSPIRTYLPDVQKNEMVVNIIKDNAFFLIFKSDIFDSPIKRRILQFLSFLYFEISIAHMMPWLNSSYFLGEFARNLQYKKPEIQ